MNQASAKKMAVAALIGITACEPHGQRGGGPPSQSLSQKESCVQKQTDQLVRARAFQADSKHWDAHLIVYECANITQDAEMVALSRQSELMAMEQRLADASEPLVRRINALERIAELDPDTAKRLQVKFGAVERQHQAEIARAAQRIAAEKRRQGVSIGMSQEDVLASNWGRPKSVNRTITAYGTREQWVYEGGYLYFENGRLTTIQK